MHTVHDSNTGLDGLLGDGRDETLAALPAVLESAKNGMAELLAQAPSPPSAVRLSIGPVTVEMDFAPAAPVAAGQTEPAQPALAPPARTAPADAQLDHVHATMVGVFYRAPEPGSKPFVSEGATVVPGQQIGIIEAMKLMIPVEADRHATIGEFLQPNGALVEYGDPLCSLIPPDGR